MRINEAEELLGISKANIRFYEKQGLLTPQRGENRYRDYTDGDIDRLRQIVILRKLGISVQDIGKILGGELLLQEAITANIASLEEQIEQLSGALKLSKQIRSEELTELDTPRYWEIIHAEEQRGGKFFEIMSEFWNGTDQWQGIGWMYHRMLLTEPGDGWKKMLRNCLLLILLWFLIRLVSGKPLDPISLFHTPIVLLGLTVTFLPVYLLGRWSPKAGRIAMEIVGLTFLVLFGALIVFIIVLFFNSHFHFWY